MGSFPVIQQTILFDIDAVAIGIAGSPRLIIHIFAEPEFAVYFINRINRSIALIFIGTNPGMIGAVSFHAFIASPDNAKTIITAGALTAVRAGPADVAFTCAAGIAGAAAVAVAICRFGTFTFAVGAKIIGHAPVAGRGVGFVARAARAVGAVGVFGAAAGAVAVDAVITFAIA